MRQDTTSAVVEHLDLVIAPYERRRRCVWYIVYDDDGRALMHYAVDEVPPRPTLDECVETSDVFANAIQHVGGEASLLVAITRPGPPSVVASDRLWYRATRQVCTARQVPLLGVHVLTAEGHREIFLDDVL
jgi:hypothetical protein